jgi:hypothetical protein
MFEKAVIFVIESKGRNIKFLQSQLALGHMFIVFAGAEAEVQCVHFELPDRCSQYGDQTRCLVCGSRGTLH